MVSAPGYTYTAVTPNDSADLSAACRALYVGVAGTVSVRAPGSTTAVVFQSVAGGSILPIFVSRVMATGTTATGIVAIY
jgi:hypothetical protein